MGYGSAEFLMIKTQKDRTARYLDSTHLSKTVNDNSSGHDTHSSLSENGQPKGHPFLLPSRTKLERAESTFRGGGKGQWMVIMVYLSVN